MPETPRDIECQEAVRQLWDYLDRELTEDSMAEVRHHLAHCGSCLPHHDFGKRFLEALATSRQRHLMPAEVRSEVMSALAEAGFTLPSRVP